MKTRYILLALASASLIAGGQAVAQGRGGGHGGANAHGSMGSQQVRGSDARLDSRGPDLRTERRERSQGPAHASDRAIERADENSALHGTVRPPGADLTRLRAGLVMRNSAGTTLGTIRRVNRSADGSVRSVLVASADGPRTIPVRPGTLSISGDIVTTTQLRPPR
jgi:hypothetical protein